MKKIIYLCVCLCSLSVFSQVGIGTNTPDTSAALDIVSTNAGILIPRMTEAQKNAITSPATGLIVYQTDGISGFWLYNGTLWQSLYSADTWGLKGNSGTTVTTHKLGTTDANALVFKANNTENFRILTNGNVGLGTATPATKIALTSPNMYTFSEDFSSLTVGNLTLVNTNNPYSFNTNTASCVAADGWRIDTTSPSAGCTLASGNRAVIDYGAAACNQNATMVVKLGTINQTNAKITFNYTFNWDKAGESFTVELYDETTSSVQATLVNLTADAANVAYESTQTITSGHSYSLRFRYVGLFGFGVTVDNIKVTTPIALLTLQDGNESAGKVLASDASGNATWTNPSAINTRDDDWRFSVAGATSNTDNIYRKGFTAIGNTVFCNQFLDVEEGTFAGQGTIIGIGNDEYFSDRAAEMTFSHNLSPLNTNSFLLGSASNRFTKVYASNNVIQTSDIRLKENIKNLTYTTQTLMQLRPVSYYWKKEKYGNTLLNPSQQKRKIGFIAQELAQIIPEVVTQKTWQKNPETNQYEQVDATLLSVNYAEILPLVVKATQEQNEAIQQIQAQQQKILSLLNQK